MVVSEILDTNMTLSGPKGRKHRSPRKLCNKICYCSWPPNKHVRLSWRLHSECHMYCWVPDPWIFCVFSGVTWIVQKPPFSWFLIFGNGGRSNVVDPAERPKPCCLKWGFGSTLWFFPGENTFFGVRIPKIH